MSQLPITCFAPNVLPDQFQTVAVVLASDWCQSEGDRRPFGTGLVRHWARSIQPKFPEISVQNSMDRFGPTGKVSKKRVHLLRWTNFPGRTGCNFGWMDHAHCPQGLFSPFFSFLRAIFSRPFSLSLAPTICPWVSEDEFYCSQPLPRATSPSAFPFHIPRFRLEGIIPLFSLYPKGYQSIEVWLKLLSQGTGQNLRSQLKDFTDPFIHKESFKISPLFIHNFDPATHLNFRQLKVVSCEQNT